MMMDPVASRQPTAIRVSAGDDLQAALDRARPGDTVLLSAGARFVGNFVLPRRGDTTAFITIRTDADGLPGPDQRTGPQYAGRLAVLQSANNEPALRTARGAHHWRVENLELRHNAGGFGDVVRLGEGDEQQRRLADVPHALVLDRLYIHGDPQIGQKRGIALNSGATEILNSYIAEMKGEGQDTQAIAGWNGPGPYRIENNYLEAAGENVLIGGGDPHIEGLVPQDIVFRRNHLTKPVAWRGGRWSVKNIFELKNARNVEIDGNTFEYSWAAAQEGYAIVLTPVNQDGGAPWSTVENVRFTNNVVRHVAAAINVNGVDPDNPSARASGLVIRNNVFLDVSGARWGGSGDFIQIGNAPAGLVVEGNTVFNDGRIISVYGGRGGEQVKGFVFRGNVARHNRYGVKGDDTEAGLPTIERFFPGAVFEQNVIGGAGGHRYPRGNKLVADSEIQRLVDAAAARLK
jgi:hypothetical protein